MEFKKNKPLVMRVLNVTLDSFLDGGKYFQISNALNHAKKLIKEGADIIDIGGESTRPNAEPVSEEEEIRRVIPVVETLRATSLQCMISVDTYKSNVARLALKVGANIINDVSGLTKDPDMIKVAKEFNCPIVIMHNRGIPATRTELANWRTGESASSQILDEVYTWLQNQTNLAIKNGIKKENIIIDPGIGFGKSPEEDLYLIEHLYEFKSLGFPILVGSSKKSFIKTIFGEENFEEKNKEIIELAIKNGAGIVRVH